MSRRRNASATGPLRDQMPTTPVPLAQGFATLGTDSGHPDIKPDIQVFSVDLRGDRSLTLTLLPFQL